MRKEAILLFHFCVTCYMCLYAFVCKKNRWDYIYLLFVYCIVLQWTFYNGECMLAYYYKKTDNPDYVAGTNFDTDYSLTFGHHFWFAPYTHLRNLTFVASVFLVCRRSRVPFFLYGTFFLLFVLSVASSICYTTGLDPTFVWYQKILQLLLMALGIAAAIYATLENNPEKVEVNPFKEIETKVELEPKVVPKLETLESREDPEVVYV